MHTSGGDPVNNRDPSGLDDDATFSDINGGVVPVALGCTDTTCGADFGPDSEGNVGVVQPVAPDVTQSSTPPVRLVDDGTLVNGTSVDVTDKADPADPQPSEPQFDILCPGCSANQTPRQCADEIANLWSLTQAVPHSVMKVPVLGGFLNGALGNTATNITGLYDFVFNSKGTMGNTYGLVVGAGPTLGIPVPGSAPAGLKGPLGLLIDSLATGAGRFVGAGKVLLDFAIYAESLNYCKTGKY